MDRVWEAGRHVSKYGFCMKNAQPIEVITKHKRSLHWENIRERPNQEEHIGVDNGEIVDVRLTARADEISVKAVLPLAPASAT